MSQAVSTVSIQRMDPMQPWGFRLQGGRDFRQTLSVKKVTRGTPADGVVHVGDGIVAIGGYDANQMTHKQATDIIRQAGNALNLSLSKGQFRSIKPAGPVKFSPGVAHQQSHQQQFNRY